MLKDRYTITIVKQQQQQYMNSQNKILNTINIMRNNSLVTIVYNDKKDSNDVLLSYYNNHLNKLQFTTIIINSIKNKIISLAFNMNFLFLPYAHYNLHSILSNILLFNQ